MHKFLYNATELFWMFKIQLKEKVLNNYSGRNIWEANGVKYSSQFQFKVFHNFSKTSIVTQV